MSDDLTLSGRVGILEHSVHKLESRMETGFSALEKGLSRLTENIQSRPVTPPFKEIITAIGATLGVVMIVANVIGIYVDRTIQLANATESGERKVIEYRLKQLEARPSAVTLAMPGLPTSER